MRNRPAKTIEANDASIALIEAIASGEMRQTVDGKNPIAVALGRLGGLKGGPARAAKMTDKERKASARKAAQARWADKKVRD